MSGELVSNQPAGPLRQVTMAEAREIAGRVLEENEARRKPLPTCPDCDVEPGMQHQEGCDVARCLMCGFQDLGGSYQADEDDPSCPWLCENTDEPIPAETMETWTGRWPGEVECEEWGWYARRTLYLDAAMNATDVPPTPDSIPVTGPSHPCTADHPHAHPDLNRLVEAAARGHVVWHREQQRFVLAEKPAR